MEHEQGIHSFIHSFFQILNSQRLVIALPSLLIFVILFFKKNKCMYRGFHKQPKIWYMKI